MCMRCTNLLQQIKQANFSLHQADDQIISWWNQQKCNFGSSNEWQNGRGNDKTVQVADLVVKSSVYTTKASYSSWQWGIWGIKISYQRELNDIQMCPARYGQAEGRTMQKKQYKHWKIILWIFSVAWRSLFPCICGIDFSHRLRWHWIC